jgi:N-acetylmuramoyl-L-alanine amidase
MKICIDAGHGGRDSGAVGNDPFQLMEKEFNLEQAILVEAELENLGHWVVMTRRTDRTAGLASRSNFANRLGAELFISIHANAAGTSRVKGIEVFHHPGSAQGAKWAARVQAGLIDAFPNHRDRGVKEANFQVLRETAMPAVLVECEFLTNPTQLKFLANDKTRRKIAKAIAGAI